MPDPTTEAIEANHDDCGTDWCATRSEDGCEVRWLLNENRKLQRKLSRIYGVIEAHRGNDPKYPGIESTGYDLWSDVFTEMVTET